MKPMFTKKHKEKECQDCEYVFTIWHSLSVDEPARWLDIYKGCHPLASPLLAKYGDVVDRFKGETQVVGIDRDHPSFEYIRELIAAHGTASSVHRSA